MPDKSNIFRSRPCLHCKKLLIAKRHNIPLTCSLECREARATCACGQSKGLQSDLCTRCRKERSKGSRSQGSLRLRFAVFNRDGFQCTYCGAKPPKVQLRLDHIIPVAKGGRTELSNLTTACHPCNAGKADSLLKH